MSHHTRQAWAADHQLVYTRTDGRGRPASAHARHAGGSAHGGDVSLCEEIEPRSGATIAEILVHIRYEEEDAAYILDVASCKAGDYISLNSNSRDTSEVRETHAWTSISARSRR